MARTLILFVLSILITPSSSFQLSPLQGRSSYHFKRTQGRQRVQRANNKLKSNDFNMISTYERLAKHSIDTYKKHEANIENQESSKQWFCAVAGGPGSGKSTLCEKVVAKINEKMNKEIAIVIPMDGYHYSKRMLKKLDPPNASTLLPVRGAPETFNAEKFYKDLKYAKNKHEMKFPIYSREKSDPTISGGVQLLPKHKIIFIEGNYLLLGKLKDDQGSTEEEDKVKEEAKRWYPLLKLFDEKWFLGPSELSGGVLQQRERLIKRHLLTWTPAKTAMWKAETAEEGAALRTDFNDVPNAYLVDRTKKFADMQIISI